MAPYLEPPAEPAFDKASFDSTVAIYEQEKAKRLRADGLAQYLEIEGGAGRLESLSTDPWADHDALNSLEPNLQDGDQVKFLVLGAGLTALESSVSLIQEGFEPADIRLVDVAGGFGGTWYWNRYPGLMCDVESYTYLPLLEETGYVPKHRFSYGQEIREYANLIAEKWNLSDKAVFRTTISSAEWHEPSRRWLVSMTQGRGPSQEPVSMTVRAQFVILANGILGHPKVPKIPGIDDFAGIMMHTCRWDYNISGGSQANPELTNLKGKKVGVIGTGATAIQLVPELAKYAGHLYVFQRTPSSVDERGQRPTDPEWFGKMSSKKGWWMERNEALLKYMYCDKDTKKVTSDGWSDAHGFRFLTGGAHDKPLTMEDFPNWIQGALEEDMPRTERIRKRVDTVVKDSKTADSLKAWYPTWCKRPCFHDEYLPAFNRPNVTLVDTDGKGVSEITKTGVVAEGEEFELDVLILSTGFRSWGGNFGDPSAKSNMTIKGRGVEMSEKWASQGATSLHGLFTHSFPNMIMPKVDQSGAAPNFTHAMLVVAKHSAHVVAEAMRRVENPDRVTIEPTVKAEEAWVAELVSGAGYMAPVGVCGPSYLNQEGKKLSQEDMLKSMRNVPHPQGMVIFSRILEDWRAEGNMAGLDVSC